MQRTLIDIDCGFVWSRYRRVKTRHSICRARSEALQVTLEALCSGQHHLLDVAIFYAKRRKRPLQNRVARLEQVGVIHTPGPDMDIVAGDSYHLTCRAGFVECFFISNCRVIDNYHGSSATWKTGSSRSTPSDVQILLRHSRCWHGNSSLLPFVYVANVRILQGTDQGISPNDLDDLSRGSTLIHDLVTGL